MASKFNFSIDQGVDNLVEITYAPGNVEFDLTGWTIECQLRRNFADTESDLTITSADDIQIATAKVTLSFLAGDTATLNGNYYYTVEATLGQSKRRIVSGVITVDPTTVRA